MRPQVWCGDEKPKRNKMISIIEGERYGCKPKGGLWTSPLINTSSPWIKFCENHNIYDKEKEKWESVIWNNWKFEDVIKLDEYID